MKERLCDLYAKWLPRIAGAHFVNLRVRKGGAWKEYEADDIAKAIKQSEPRCKCGHVRSWHIRKEQPEECGFHWRDEEACIIDCRCEKYQGEVLRNAGTD